VTAYQAMRTETGQGASVARNVTSFVNAVKVYREVAQWGALASSHVTWLDLPSTASSLSSVGLPSRCAVIVILAASPPRHQRSQPAARQCLSLFRPPLYILISV
jgi:hypothetical protein